MFCTKHFALVSNSAKHFPEFICTFHGIYSWIIVKANCIMEVIQ